MTAGFQVIWGSGDAGENGIFDRETGRQVVSPYTLRKMGLSSAIICTWDDKAIERLVKRVLGYK